MCLLHKGHVLVTVYSNIMTSIHISNKYFIYFRQLACCRRFVDYSLLQYESHVTVHIIPRCCYFLACLQLKPCISYYSYIDMMTYLNCLYFFFSTYGINYTAALVRYLYNAFKFCMILALIYSMILKQGTTINANKMFLVELGWVLIYAKEKVW